MLEREVFNMNGLPGRVVHSPKREFGKRAKSYDSHLYPNDGVNTTYVHSTAANDFHPTDLKGHNPEANIHIQKLENLQK